MKVAGAELVQIVIVQRRGSNGECARRHRIAHAKSQKPLDDAPMAPAGRDIVDTGRSETPSVTPSPTSAPGIAPTIRPSRLVGKKPWLAHGRAVEIVYRLGGSRETASALCRQMIRRAHS